MQIAPVDSAQTRAAVWIAERLEKSRHVEEGDPSLLERAFLWAETSVETGFLGVGLLGLPVFAWMLLAFIGAVLFVVVRALRRRFVRNASAATVLVAFSVSLEAPKGYSGVQFYIDDPIQVDPDTLPFDPPAPRELSEAFNLLEHTLATEVTLDGPAINVNSVGDVPASSWFEERRYAQRSTLEQLRNGYVAKPGPDTSSAWNVVQVERDGKSLGLQIVDGSGERYILKLDARDFPEVSTGAEVVTSRLLHALGYRVPHNTIVRFSLDHVQPGREDVTSQQITSILEQAYLYPDSTYRAIASKYIEGRPIGPFKFYGTRPDDPNDIFPHELRRELRGLRLVSAWLNHTDVRAENTLTSAIPVDTGAYVRHYLIDFGTTLGGSPFGEQRPWAGHEYWLRPVERLKHILSFGLYDAEWEGIDPPDIRGVGRFTAEGFNPGSWVPIQPNPAFRLMDAADAFWAAARIGSFSEEEIRAAVQAGEYQDSAAVEYITNVLLARRDRIVNEYVDFGGGLDRLRISGGTLFFTDLLEWIESAKPIRETVRTARWWRGDSLIREEQFATDSLRVPDAQFERVEILTPPFGTTQIYVRNGDIVGVERCGTENPCDDLERRQSLRQDIFTE